MYSLRRGYFGDNPQCMDSSLPIEHLRGLGVRGGMFEILTRLIIPIQYKLERKTREHANTKHNRCLTTAISTQAHKRYSKMAKSKENTFLPDFDVNYILN